MFPTTTRGSNPVPANPQMPSGHGKTRCSFFCWLSLTGSPYPKKGQKGRIHWATKNPIRRVFLFATSSEKIGRPPQQGMLHYKGVGLIFPQVAKRSPLPPIPVIGGLLEEQMGFPDKWMA